MADSVHGIDFEGTLGYLRDIEAEVIVCLTDGAKETGLVKGVRTDCILMITESGSVMIPFHSISRVIFQPDGRRVRKSNTS
jgi:sRNA-binding regulator protein Hfq